MKYSKQIENQLHLHLIYANWCERNVSENGAENGKNRTDIDAYITDFLILFPIHSLHDHVVESSSETDGITIYPHEERNLHSPYGFSSSSPPPQFTRCILFRSDEVK